MDSKTDSTKGLGDKPTPVGKSGNVKKNADKLTEAKDKSDIRKDAPKDQESQGISKVAKAIKEIRQFLKEVVIEFRKITWPTRPQVIQETYSVIFLVTAITLILLGFDWILGHAVFGPLEHWARIHGGGIGRG